MWFIGGGGTTQARKDNKFELRYIQLLRIAFKKGSIPT